MLHGRESFPFSPTTHFSQVSVTASAVYCAEKDAMLRERNIAILRTMEHLLSSHSQPPDTSHSRTADPQDRAGIAVWLLYRDAWWWVGEQVLLARSVSVA